MYEDNNVTYRVGINWKDILVKVILLILFILLLVWLFPKPKLDVFYDNVYANNVKTMKEAARNYYTVDRLPKSVGEQTSMTLKEMIDNHMIIRFTDKDGKTCDETSSKVSVTKISDSEYSLKVALNCGDQSDYILETIGCTTVCSQGTCTTVINNGNSNGNSVAGVTSGNGSNTGAATGANNAGTGSITSGTNTTGATEHDDTDYSGYSVKDGIYTVTYYQHRKAVKSSTTVYTCPEGYTKNGTKCTKNTTGATIDATPHYNPDQVITTDAKLGQGEESIVYANYIRTQTGTDYSCPTGYTLNGSYCIKYTEATEKPGDSTYTCPTGYTLNGKKCTKTYDATPHQGTGAYSCPSGGTLDGKKCVLTQAATATTTYTCPSGYTKNGTSCYKVYDAKSTTTYTCPNGGSLSGTKCIVTTSSTYNATASTSYSCPSDYTRNGTSCYKTYNATASTKYSCPSGGTLSGSTCVKSGSYAAKASTSTVYGNWVNGGTQYLCSSGAGYTGDTSKLVFQGAVSGVTCNGVKGIGYKYIYYSRSKSTKTTYSCPNGGSLSGSTCYTSSSYAASATTSYSCPSGGSLNGSKCTITTSATSSTKYSCPNGGTLDGKVCRVSSTSSYNATANTKYSCPDGGTLNGTKCTITTTATSSTKYSCPSGYTLSGKNCTKSYDATYTPGATSYTCPDGGTLNGTKCTITKDATEKPGTPTYSCPSGYTYNSSTKKCESKINATATPKYSYTCPEGYTKSGEGENTKCSKKIIIQGYYCEDADAKLTEDHKCVKTVPGTIAYYTCPEGYTLSGTKCTKDSVITIDATATTKETISYKYTWSKNSYLDGWEFTGKTKTQTYSAGQK